MLHVNNMFSKMSIITIKNTVCVLQVIVLDWSMLLGVPVLF